jgi:hypothetical protein
MNTLEKENYLAAFSHKLSHQIISNTLQQISQPQLPSQDPETPEESFIKESNLRFGPELPTNLPPVVLQTLEQSFLPTIPDYGSDEEIVEDIEADQFHFEKPRSVTDCMIKKFQSNQLNKNRSESSFISEEISISRYLEEEEISATIGITSRTDISRYVN